MSGAASNFAVYAVSGGIFLALAGNGIAAVIRAWRGHPLKSET